MSDSNFFYPDLDLQTLKNLEIVRQLVTEHKSYWLTSPYPSEIERLCSEWFKPKKVQVEMETSSSEPGEGGDWEFLYRESRSLFEQLKVAGVGLEDSDKMAYFRTSTALLEKLLGMQERANNLKQVSNFYQSVMDIMETVLSPTQRTEVMEKLEELVKGAA